MKVSKPEDVKLFASLMMASVLFRLLPNQSVHTAAVFMAK